jgi:chromosome segregation ATPase
LYLAEVIQRKGGLIGGGKAELKLLACQRSEQSWSAVTGEEVIGADEVSKYNQGTLLLVDLTASKQIQRVQEAGRPLVSILQNFSRLQEKFKTQEEEIEQWKQSLTYQSQELNRREMEMEARREQLEQLEEDFERLENQRQDLEANQAEIEQLRSQLERQQQDLEGAWEHLRGEQNRLEERQTKLQQTSVLDEQQAHTLQDGLQMLGRTIVPLEELQGRLHQIKDGLSGQQTLLLTHWQQLEQYRASVDQQQTQLQQQTAQLQQRWHDWQQAQEQLEQAKVELSRQEATLQAKQAYIYGINVQMQHYDELHRMLYSVSSGLPGVSFSVSLNLEELEHMPIEQLQHAVTELESDFERSFRFVEGQEEELDLKQQEIDELEAKLSEVSEFDRLSLGAELNDERDAYQFLRETLIGQQRNLAEKEGILRQHQVILARRQGKPAPDGAEGMVNLGPVIEQLDSLRHQQAEQLRHIEDEVSQIHCAIEQAQQIVKAQSQAQESQCQELRHSEHTIQQQHLQLGELTGKLNLYQEMLQPVQDGVDHLQQRLEELAGSVEQLRVGREEQQQTLGQIHQVLNGLMPQPEMI